jgi:ribonuclease P protein component
MLAKKYKLTGTKDYTNVQEHGSVYQSKNFGVAFLKREDENPSRYGFIVSTKIAKEAVERNRVRRILSDAVRINTIGLVPGYDVVFLAKTSIIRVSTVDLMKEVVSALKGAGLMK